MELINHILDLEGPLINETKSIIFLHFPVSLLKLCIHNDYDNYEEFSEFSILRKPDIIIVWYPEIS